MEENVFEIKDGTTINNDMVVKNVMNVKKLFDT